MKNLLIAIILILSISCSSNSEDDSTPGQKSLENGDNSFRQSSYAAAISHYQSVLSESNDKNIRLKAITGLGFANMRIKSFGEAEKQFNNGFDLDSNSLDIRAGKVLINYSYKRDYSKAVSLANKFLTNKNYQLYLDSKLDIKDLLLTMALAHFELKDFNNCYMIIDQHLNESMTFQTSDSEIVKKLLDKLESLISKYSS